jgi:hypothetical protein
MYDSDDVPVIVNDENTMDDDDINVITTGVEIRFKWEELFYIKCH